MKEAHKKMVRVGAEIGMWTLLFFGMVIVYFAGVQNGQLEMCEQNNLTLINNRGSIECWDDFRVQEYRNQWEVNNEHGLQYNFT